MSVQRTPPSTPSTGVTLRNKTGGRDGSEPQLNTTMEIQDNTPPDYDYFRNRRPREEEATLSQFQEFKMKIKEIMTS